MGGTNWDHAAYTSYSCSVASTPRDTLFKSTSADATVAAGVAANNIKIRESRDSAANPLSTPVIIASDVTGSMGVLAEILVKSGLGIIMKEIIDRRPITDPHVMGIAIGDGTYDTAPIQATQFEASTVIVDQLTKFFIEARGGGNEGESYAYAWLFAELKCVCDSQIKRGKKGYIFTIGDEAPLLSISSAEIEKHFGETDYPAISDIRTLLKQVQERWNVYHLIIKPISQQPVLQTWESILGDNAILVQDKDLLPQVIVSIIQANEGHDKGAIAASWNGSTSIVVSNAISKIVPSADARANSDTLANI